MAFNIVPATSPAFQAPATMDWNNPMGGLGQDIIDYLKNNQVASTTPEGKWGAGQAQIGINGAGMYVLPGGDASFGTPGYGVVSGGQGGGYYYKPLNGNETNAANYSYNPDGSYNHTDYNSHIMSPAQGVASVIGAGLGFGAIGAMAGGAAAGAGTGAATGGTFGAGGLGTGTATGGVGYGLSGGGSLSGLSGATYGGVGGLGGVDFGAGLGAAAGGAAGGAAGSTFGGGLGTGTPTGASYGLNTGLGGEAAGSTYGGSALASSPYDWSAATGGLPAGAGGGGGSGGSGGTSMGAGPSTSGATPSTINIPGLGDVPLSTLAQWGVPLAGALAGSQGVQKTTTQTQSMDPRLDSLFYGGLAPATAATLGTQMPAAKTAGDQMMSVGAGLLGTSSTPNFASNPYMTGVADDLQKRTADLLGQNNLSISGNAVASGGLGGARQGIAQGLAASKAADYLQGNLANLYQSQYNTDATRALQQQTLGAGLLSQGIDTQFQPLKDAAGIYSPFTGFGTTNQTQNQGGGAMGAVGGAIGAYGLGKQLFGNASTTGSSSSGGWW